MTSLEELRQELMAAFKAVHTAYYPDTLVNYPNFTVVDIERQVDPFVSVGLDFSDIEQAAMGEKDINVPGFLNIYFYYRVGRGSSGAYSYADMLNEHLAMSQIGSLRFRAVKLRDIQTFPGWKGLMISLRFDIVAPLASCQ